MASNVYNLIFEEHPEYLFACVHASVISLDIAVNYINETIDRLRQTGASKLLFVRETPMMMSASHYAVVGSFIINLLPKDVRIALVDQSPAHNIVVGFINSEAQEKNREIRAFDDFDQAEQWLLMNSQSVRTL